MTIAPNSNFVSIYRHSIFKFYNQDVSASDGWNSAHVTENLEKKFYFIPFLLSKWRRCQAALFRLRPYNLTTIFYRSYYTIYFNQTTSLLFICYIDYNFWNFVLYKKKSRFQICSLALTSPTIVIMAFTNFKIKLFVIFMYSPIYGNSGLQDVVHIPSHTAPK